MDDIDYDIDDNDVILNDDQKLIKILNDRMCNVDKSIMLINKTINMLISDIKMLIVLLINIIAHSLHILSFRIFINF